ncbi:MAG TPA: hypothetical protein VN740_05975 [Solirubrobacteraceae bacterium]|nr:hypothetical protein [Solirubrobacteraceae bacterium]
MFETFTRSLRIAAPVAALSLVLVAGALASSSPISVTASPSTASRGQTVTVSGGGWGVIEFCRPRVSLALVRSAPLRALPIATVNLRTGPKNSGTFSTAWTVPRSVHSGLRTIAATQRCESGKNGSPLLITRTTAIRVR